MSQWTRGQTPIMATKSRYFVGSAPENSQKAPNWTLHFAGMTELIWLIPTASVWLFQGPSSEGSMKVEQQAEDT